MHAGTHSRQSKDVKECACRNTRRAKTRQNLPAAIPRKLYLCFFGGCAFSKSSVSIFFERLSPSARLYEGSCQAYLGILQQASMRRWALACESLSRCRGKVKSKSADVYVHRVSSCSLTTAGRILHFCRSPFHGGA